MARIRAGTVPYIYSIGCPFLEQMAPAALSEAVVSVFIALFGKGCVVLIWNRAISESITRKGKATLAPVTRRRIVHVNDVDASMDGTSINI